VTGDAEACAGELALLRDGVSVDPVPRILAPGLAFSVEVFGSGFIMLIAGIDAALGKSASTTAFFWFAAADWLAARTAIDDRAASVTVVSGGCPQVVK